MSGKISRRTFLKGAIGVAAGASLLKPSNAKAQAITKQVKWNPSICNFCSTTCSIMVASRKVGNKVKAVKIEGNSKSTLNQGRICARGQTGLQLLYNPDRLKYPLIRVKGSRRGEWKFRKATWDEAIDYIARKIEEHNIQPWEWAMTSGWFNCVFYMPVSLAFSVAYGMPNIVASPMQHCVGSSHFGNDLVIGDFNIHDEVLADYDKADVILAALGNASMAGISTSRAVRFGRAARNGAEIFILDPRLSETAAKATKWIPIKPGTDLEFFLAMMNEMLNKGYYNEDFVKNHTNMSHLVYAKNGQPVMVVNKKKNIPAQFYVYDVNKKRAVAVPGYTNTNEKDIEGNPVSPALEVPAGTRHNGKEVITVFQLFKKILSQYAPEWAEKITTVPASAIREIAKKFGTAKHPVMDPGWHGSRYQNIVLIRRVQTMIQALTGNIDKEGGWVFSGEHHHKVANFLEAMKKSEEVKPGEKPGMLFAQGLLDVFGNPNAWPHKHPHFSFAKSIVNAKQKKPFVLMPAFADYGLDEAVEGKLNWIDGKPYNIKLIFMNGNNPIRNYYTAERWGKLLTHKNVKLVIAYDILPADHVAYADVVLPAATYLERYEPFIYGNGPNPDMMLTTRYPAVDPLYDTKDYPDFTMMFMEKAGKIDEFFVAMEKLFGLPAAHYKKVVLDTVRQGGTYTFGFRKATEMLMERKFPGIMEKIKKNGVALIEKREKFLVETPIFWKLPAPTPSGRVEFYSYMMAMMVQKFGYNDYWDPTIKYIASEISQKKLTENEFYFIYGKIPTESHASAATQDNRVLSFVNNLINPMERYGLWINKKRAINLGIKTGDLLEVTNTKSGQKVKIQAYVTEGVRPDTVFMPSSFGAESPMLKVASGVGAPLSEIVSYDLEPIAAGFKSQEFTVKIKKI